MNKKLLILEPSKTTQSLILAKLKKAPLDISFETHGVKFLVAAYNTTPDAILINAKAVNPKSSELIRLIKNIEKFKNLPVGVYATSDFYFEEHYMFNTGTDVFISFENDSFVDKITQLLEKAKSKKLNAPLASDIIKNGISEKLFLFMSDVEDLNGLVQKFLNLLTEFCEVPAVSLFLSTDDGVFSYFMCAQNFTEAEQQEFLKVCTSDFDQLIPDSNILKTSPQFFEPENSLEKYHTHDIPLSAFQSVEIKNAYDWTIGTVNMVREGTFTTHQVDLLNYSV